MFKLLSRQEVWSPQRLILPLLCTFGLLGGVILPAHAQDSEEFRLSVRRDWGYGGGDQIQGYFSLEALGPDNIASVTFRIDDQAIATVTTPPFKFQINTDDFPHGWHALIAVATTADGRILTSAPRRFEFVSAEAGWSTVQKIILGTGSMVGVLLVVVFALQFIPALFGKKKSALPLGASRNYGLKGGAICPKCHRPFSVHLMSFNLGPRYYDYCDHCGKWSLVKRASGDELRAAETAEFRLAQPEMPIAEESPEEKLKRQLEESRYTNSD